MSSWSSQPQHPPANLEFSEDRANVASWEAAASASARERERERERTPGRKHDGASDQRVAVVVGITYDLGSA